MMDELNKTHEKNGLKVNIEKTNFMKIGRSIRNVRITVDGAIFQQV